MSDLATARSLTVTRRGGFLRALAAAGLAALVSVAPTTAQGSIVLPSQRACVVFIPDLDRPGQSWIQRQFYNFAEFAAESAANTILFGHYGTIRVVKGSYATRARLTATLRSFALDTDVKALDLLFVGHGLGSHVYFTDTHVSIDTVANDIRAVTTWEQRRKFRMLHSTACYGESHMTGWRRAGFKMVSGSRRICAGVSFPAFLMAWAGGFNHYEAVNLSNTADPVGSFDQIAKLLLRTWGYSRWWDVDSDRVREATMTLRIWQRSY